MQLSQMEIDRKEIPEFVEQFEFEGMPEEGIRVLVKRAFFSPEAKKEWLAARKKIKK